MSRARIWLSVLFVAAAVGCSADVEDPADEDGIGVMPPVGSSKPAQLSCDELVECLLRERDGGPGCIDMQDALEDAEQAIEICEAPDFTGDKDDCYAAWCE